MGRRGIPETNWTGAADFSGLSPVGGVTIQPQYAGAESRDLTVF
jgi:hypothetical protein